MNCREAQDRILTERDGALDQTSRVALAGHLADCAGCRRVRDDLTAAVSAWRAEVANVRVPGRRARVARRPPKNSGWRNGSRRAGAFAAQPVYLDRPAAGRGRRRRDCPLRFTEPAVRSGAHCARRFRRGPGQQCVDDGLRRRQERLADRVGERRDADGRLSPIAPRSWILLYRPGSAGLQPARRAP
jgi:hypothetical protein